MDSVDGKAVSLKDFEGKILLIVNLATFWGATVEQVTVIH